MLLKNNLYYNLNYSHTTSLRFYCTENITQYQKIFYTTRINCTIKIGYSESTLYHRKISRIAGFSFLFDFPRKTFPFSVIGYFFMLSSSKSILLYSKVEQATALMKKRNCTLLIKHYAVYNQIMLSNNTTL